MLCAISAPCFEAICTRNKVHRHYEFISFCYHCAQSLIFNPDSCQTKFSKFSLQRSILRALFPAHSTFDGWPFNLSIILVSMQMFRGPVLRCFHHFLMQMLSPPWRVGLLALVIASIFLSRTLLILLIPHIEKLWWFLLAAFHPYE